MLVEERRREILSLLNARNSIRVAELSELFSVTKETIRKDLEVLEQRGQLLRSHGGALRISRKELEEIPYAQREVMNAEKKEKIAHLASKQIEEKDTIILDASTTAWNLAKLLPNMELKVITNSLRVASELSLKPRIKVLCTGGVLNDKTLSFTGLLAGRQLELFHVNKAFLSCTAFDLDRGMSDSSEEQARIKEKMLENSDLLYAMIDSSKFDQTAFSHFARPRDIDYIITDDSINQELKSRLESKSWNLLVAHSNP